MSIDTTAKENLIQVDRINRVWTYVLFFLWPLFAVIQSCKNLGQSYSRTVIVLFFGLFGLNLVFDATDDSSRHKANFIEIAAKPFSDFFNIVSGLYSDKGQKPDFVMDLIGFVVSRFTSNSGIFFMVLGLTLGWIVAKNVKVLYELYMQHRTLIGLCFLIFFMMLLSPGRILSYRHYFALGVYVYSIYQYLNQDKQYYLLLIASTVFIHFGYLMVVPLFFLYKFVGNRNTAFYVLIVLSFVFADVAASLIRDFGMGSDTNLDAVVKGYTHKKYLKQVSGLQEQRNVILNNFIRWTTLFFLLSMLYHKYKYKVFDKVSENLYSFSLLFFAFVNFMVGMESIANRFSIVFQALACFFFIHLYSVNRYKTPWIFKYSLLGVLLVNLIITIRLTLEFTNFNSILPLLPLSLFIESNTSLLEVIKSL